MEPRHERIAKIALAAGGRYGLALAGGYAVQAHGMGSRPSGDVDLFTSWQRRDEFPELTSAVVSALEAAGYAASVAMRAETFVRLMVADHPKVLLRRSSSPRLPIMSAVEGRALVVYQGCVGAVVGRVDLVAALGGAVGASGWCVRST